MKRLNFLGLLVLATHFAVPIVYSAGAGQASGLTLLRNSGARSSALGEAFVSMADDVTALDFNPASLATLERNQASLAYEKRFADDSFSKATVGFRNRFNGALGVAVGRYDSGKAVLFDGINPEKSVTAQQDLISVLGYAFKKNAASFGASFKYLKSELAETNSATAYSGDIGAQYKLPRKFRVGAAGPVVTSKLRYTDTGEKLPRVYRMGIGWDGSLFLATGKIPLQLLLDVPYDVNDHGTSIALGAETRLGIMALRMGLNTRSDLQQFSMGAGFLFRQVNLDYSFGVVSNGAVDSVHKVNVSMRFGRDPADNSLALATPPHKKDYGSHTTYQVYQVKDGETLESIAQARYGSAAKWHEIYALNRTQYPNPEEIKPGSKILVPE